MEITNQYLEEMLAMVICATIPVVIRIPLLASLGRFSHLGTVPALKKTLLFTVSLCYELFNFLQSSPF
jgi:hypothetical protein